MSKQEDQASLQPNEAIKVAAGSLEFLYTATHNPLYAWQCLLLTAQHGADLPEWVSNYLIVSGNNICELIGTKPSPVATAVSKAFGFAGGSGSSSTFSRIMSLDTAKCVAISVCIHLEQGNKLDYVYDIVAEEAGISRTAVRDAYALHCHLLAHNN
jgi:hypothetical protein